MQAKTKAIDAGLSQTANGIGGKAETGRKIKNQTRGNGRGKKE
jgi:hypothetical protein